MTHFTYLDFDGPFVRSGFVVAQQSKKKYITKILHAHERSRPDKHN
jgi:hypothetical protein